MTDILDHLQPDSPLYEATRDAAREEIIRLRSRLKEMAEAATWLLEEVDYFKRAQETSAEFDAAVESANAALTKYRGKE